MPVKKANEICVASSEVVMHGDITIHARVAVVTKAKLDDIRIRGECLCDSSPTVRKSPKPLAKPSRDRNPPALRKKFVESPKPVDGLHVEDISSSLFWLLAHIGDTLETEKDLEIAKLFFNEALLVLKNVLSKDLCKILLNFCLLESKNEYESFSEKWFKSDGSGLDQWLKWNSCYSENENKRRGPCGMWKLLHVMSIYGPEKSTIFPKAADYSSMIADFIPIHFPCASCREDFSKRIGKSRGNLKVRNPSQIKNNDDLIIWLWKLHNDVNLMLINDPELDSGYGDLENFPKRVWPNDRTSEREIVGILRKEYKIR